MLAKIEISKLGSFLIVLSVLLISIFGPAVIMGLTQGGEMTGCPLVGGIASMCQMSVIEHISYWQQLFTATSSNTITTLAFLLFLFLLGTNLALSQNKRISWKLFYKFYNRNNPQALLFNYLILVFSTGILHPKVY